MAHDDVSANTSNFVYIQSEDYAWIPCRLLETDGSTAVVSVPHFKDEQDVQSGPGGARKHDKVTVELDQYHNKTLLLQNVDEKGNLKEVEDMVDLPFLHEAAILYNLKKRHHRGKPYTRTGDIVIAVNPYQWFHQLYSEDVRQQYSAALVWEDSEGDPRTHLQPHIYESSALAYRGLAVEGQSQSILVSGESGAGKTESVKICLNHIASVQRGVGHETNVAYESPIVKRVLDSNPLLEAFGNAKTVRNDNSSRFGKYITLQFDSEDPYLAAYAGKAIPSCVLAGSQCQVYLLEKSRVVMHEEEERTYHIFYQLLAADEQVKTSFWEGLADTDNESFRYVGYTETDVIEGMTDAQRFQQTIESLALIGIKEEKLITLMRAICIVLQLGNLAFEKDEKDDTRSVITTEDELSALAALMGVANQDLLAALTIRTMRARNEEFKVPLNSVQAKDSCDAFAKEIYAKAFLWLVRAINDATCAEKNYDGERKSDYGIIGLLDIFGFESFETNRFEQLCINYANEKLQQKFTQDIFRSVQAEYEAEGIELEEIKYDDNTDVLDLVEGRMGLLAVLNEECVRPGGSDKSFVAKVYAMNKDNPIFLREKVSDDHAFGVKHYAGEVFYDATGFVTKNTDTLPTDFQECAQKSTNDILANHLQNDHMMNESSTPTKLKRKSPPKGGGTSTKSRKASIQKKNSNLIGSTVWTKFKSQLTSLMTSLSQTRTRYIRCIKPNEFKEPLVMQHISTIEQLRCAGVVAAVTISRSAFPNRLEHEVVLDRFKALWKKREQQEAEKEADAEEDSDKKTQILANALLSLALKSMETEMNGTVIKGFVIGNTRTYFRAGSLEHLEAERVKRLGVWAVEIQKIVRAYLLQKKYQAFLKAIVVLEKNARMKSAVQSYRRMRSASVSIECWYRCLNASRTLTALRRKHRSTKIQAYWRMLKTRSQFVDQRQAAVVVQAIMRCAIQRPKFQVALQEKREEAKLENQVIALQKKLEEAERARVEAEKAAEEKARRAIEQFQEEKKDASVAPEPPTTPIPVSVVVESDSAGPISAQQQTLMDESGKMLEYLRKEVFKLRSQNAQMRTDLDLLKDNNQRLMDANASAGASFAALNQHAKQLTRTNEKLQGDLGSFKQQVQKLSVTQVELKEELKMKQATYVAEVHSRLQYQKALTKIVDLVSDKCRDSRLVESVLQVADECESDYMKGPTGIDARPTSLFTTPPSSSSKPNSNNDSSTGLMSSIRSLWS